MKNNFISKFILKGIEQDIEQDIKQTYTMKENNSKSIADANKVIEKSKAVAYGVIKKYISYVNTNKLQEKQIKVLESTTTKQIEKLEKSIDRITNNNNFNIKLYNCLLYANYKEKHQAQIEIDRDIIYNKDMEIENENEIKERYKDINCIYKKSRIVTPNKKSYKVILDTSAIETFEEYTNIIVLSIYENFKHIFVKNGNLYITKNIFKNICKPLKKAINLFYRDTKRHIEIDNNENQYILENQSFIDYKKLFTNNKYKIDINKMIKDLKLNSKQLEIISYKINGLTFENISQILNIGLSATKMCFYRLNEKIKNYLQLNYNIAI